MTTQNPRKPYYGKQIFHGARRGTENEKRPYNEKHTDRTIAKKELKLLREKFTNSPYSLDQIIRGWAEFMVTQKSYAGNVLSPSTIRNYVGQISNRIAGYANDEDITLLEGEGLEEIYRQILSDVMSESYKQNIARGLKEFHFYLVEKFHLAPINYKEILGLVSPDRIVDANIISFDEYHAILDDLDRQHSELSLIHKDLPDIVRLICILSFRCGLRRSEVLKLMIDDLHDMHPVVLLIRPNFARTLKTKSTVRQLPLSILLSPHERDDLILFLNKRLHQESNSHYSDFLFAIPSNLNLIAPAVKVFSIITETMKRVTEDPAPKFHHLRHSFASWSVFRLMLTALHLENDIKLPNMPITTTYLRDSAHFNKELLGTNFPTRKYVRAVASLLGHSGPESSVPHYIHFSDMLLKLTLDKRIPCNDHIALAKLLNVHRSTSYRWHTQGGIDGLTRNFRKKSTRLRHHSKIRAEPFVNG